MNVDDKIALREKRLSDARDDYIWQTDPELAVLDASVVLLVSFQQYLLDYASILRYPTSHRYSFGVDTPGGKHIGNCTCYDINEAAGEAQLGIIIGDRDYWDKGYGTDAMNALVDRIFLETDLKRLYLKTLDWNVRAQKCFQKCGFTLYGRVQQNGYSFLVMELNRKQWQEQRERKDLARNHDT